MFIYLSETFLFFILYSFMGWICECIFCSINQSEIVNRGMLKGPYCPIYGLGALFMLPLTEPLREHPVLVFFAAMLVTSALEYFSSWLLEKMFNIRWWDYSDQSFQLNGRICLPLAVAFGAMGWVLTYSIHPAVQGLVSLIPAAVRLVGANMMMAIFLFDLVKTVGSIMGVSGRLQELQSMITEVKGYDEQYSWLDINDWKESLVRLREICMWEDSAASGEIVKRLDSIDGISIELQSFIKRHPSLNAKKWREAVGVVRGNTLKRIRLRHIIFLRDNVKSTDSTKRPVRQTLTALLARR